MQVKLGHLEFSDGARARINQIMETGRVSYGPYCKELEERLAIMHGADYGVLSNSGTSSLQIALQALKILNNWPDDAEVIVPATTFVATANIVLQCNLRPVFVDVLPDTYDISPVLFAEAITPKTVCVIPVNVFGQTCSLDAISVLTEDFGLKTIIDSCECIGVDHRGNKLAEYADVVCFSFYVAHIVIGGVGGLGITKDKELADLMRSLVNHGRHVSYISIDDQVVNLTDRFTFDQPGYSYRITEFEAALALSYVDTLPDNILKRQTIAATYNNLLKDISFLQLPKHVIGHGHSWMMYPLVITTNIDKNRLCAWLEKNGIETRDMLPLVNQPVAQSHYKTDINNFPVSKWLTDKGFYISCSPHLTIEDCQYVADIIKDVS